MIRVANCSGFYGDRLSAAREQVEGGEIDVLTGDYLAELTMALLLRDRMKDPSAGYAKTFLLQLRDVLGPCLARGIKIVVNAGGLNPKGLAAAVTEAAGRAGLSPKVAWVEGDDVSAGLASLGPLPHLDTGVPLSDAPGPALAANAYLGCWPIARALQEGADIVVTGRCTDAAVVMGPAAWRHGWKVDDWDALAGALVAAHVIECGTQATGGNHPFWREVDLRHPGFPIAEIEADGTSVITKHAGTGGRVDVDTVKAQLLYEVGGRRYLSPDVVADLGAVRLVGDGPDRVRIDGVVGGPPPETLKVGVLVSDGWRNQVKVLLGQPHAREKARIVDASFWADVGGRERFTEARSDLLGGDGTLDTPEDALAVLLLTARHPDRDAVGRRFTGAAVALALASVPGITLLDPPESPRPCVAFWPVAVPKEAVVQRVHLGEDVLDVPHPPTPGLRHDWPRLAAPQAAPVVPREDLVGARSGDKAGHANVGLWVRDPGLYAWLVDTATPDALRSWLGFEGRIERHELPNLWAVNFVVHGWLGRGVGASARVDSQAKCLAEYVRARLLRADGRDVDAGSV